MRLRDLFGSSIIIITHVGFVLMTVYKDHTAVKKVMARPEYDKMLCEEVLHLAEQYELALEGPSF